MRTDPGLRRRGVRLFSRRAARALASALAILATATAATAAEVVIDLAAANTGTTYTSGAAVASYLAGYGVTTPNNLFVHDTPTYLTWVASPTKNIMTGGDGRNPTVMTLEFATGVSNFSFTRAGIRGENSPSGTIAGDWTATAYDASNAPLGSVGEPLTSFYGSRASQVFAINASGIRKVVFQGYDRGYAGINTPHITLITFTTATTTGNTLTVALSGTGTGTVTSSPAGISCGSSCSASFTAGSSVTLTASASAGSRFTGWSGACSGTGSCVVTMSGALSVTATFDAKLATTTTLTSSVNPSTPGQGVTFTASVAGSGGTPSGTVTIKEGATTHCGPLTLSAGQAQCSLASLATGSHALTAEYSGDGIFQASTSGALTQNVGVSGVALSVTRSGSGSGSVTSSPAGISCGSTCSATFASGSSVTLTASAAAGSRFAGWSGACSGSGSCVVTMSAAQAVAATFELAPTGEVVIDLAAANTGTTYTSGAAVASYLAGYGVTTPNNLFVHDTPTYLTWVASPTKNIMTGGDGRNPTVMTLEFATGVSNFSFTRAGIRGENSPSGTIAGDWTATAYNASNVSVGSVGETLTSFYGSRASRVFAINASGIRKVVFQGYDHGYAGINTPHITLITFTTATSTASTLSVTRGGTGTGTVTSSPAGISCGSSCSASFTAGSSVTLTASAAAGSRFTGWSGACSGTGSCVVTMSGALSATATFDAKLATTTTLTSSVNPSTPGQGVTFTASVASSVGTPPGTVTVKEGGTIHCGPVALSAGRAQCSVSSLATGSHALTAEYSGDATYQASASGVLTQDVIASSPSAGPAIATSATHSLAVDAQGRVFAWGSDHRGQLGQGRTVTRATPFQVTGLPLASYVAIARHVLVVDFRLQVWSWGDNSCGQLGPRDTGVTTRPARVSGARDMTMVAAGLCFSLALKTDGTVWAWGDVPGYSGTHLRQIQGLSNIIEIAAGSRHALALAANGVVYVFGDNTDGQLGLGSAGSVQQAVAVTGIPAVARIAAGDTTSMVMHSDNSLRFWGRHQDGTLVAAPRSLSGLGGTATTLSVTGNRPYAGRVDGTVLGYRAASSDWAAEFPGFASIEKLAAGNSGFVLGINGSGQLSAAGLNSGGQLGLGHTNAQSGVVPVPGFASTRMVRTGALDGSVVALRNDGSVWFWGADTAGEAGDGSIIGSSVPRQVSLPTQATMVAAGDGFSAALDRNGVVYGWGANAGGVFGASSASRSTPAQLAGAGVVAIAAGPRVLAYLGTDGSVAYSGTMPPLAATTERTPIAGFANIRAIAVGENTLYGLTADGRVFAVGANGHGELGNGTVSPSASPVQVLNITGAVARISAARFRAAAVTSDGRVYNWGLGPLGNGSTAGSITPTQVSGLTGAADVSVGAQGTLVKRSDGTLAAWGDMGLADAGSNPLAVYSVSLPSPAGSIQAGRGNELGFIVSSSGLAWGFGRYGALASTSASLGDGTYVRRGRAAVLLAPGGSGNLDTNDWYFDLDPSSPESIPAAYVPRMLGESRLFAGGDGLSMGATIRYRAADFDRPVANYVFGLVPPSFFDVVKSAAGVPDKALLQDMASKNGGFIPIQLTANGWTTLSGQPVAFSQGVATAAGNAAGILDSTAPGGLSGSRFCIGYGQTSDAMLNAGTLVEVLQLEGTTAPAANGENCVIPGIYIDGPPGSRAGTPVSFKALVVGPSPSGTVQFRDGSANLLSPLAITSANAAVSTAAITTSNLTVGEHSIGGIYSGDAQNAQAVAAFPVRHTVVAVAPGASRTTLEGPTSSLEGTEVAFVATVIGNSPTGTVQFWKFTATLGDPVPLVGGVATLRVATLEPGLTRKITAVYSGDGANASSTSNEILHKVEIILNTTVTLTSSSPTSIAGTSVRLTATVTGANPTGTVTLRDGAAVLATLPLAAGTAVYDASFDAGVHTLTADYSGDAYNTPRTSDALFQQVGLPSSSASQTIAFDALANRTYGDAAFTITATASSGLTVTFTSASSSVCTVSGSTVTILAAGTCTIDANQAGNLTYAAAPQVSRSFTVAKADQAISFATLPGRVFGAPPFEVSATASSGLAVTFTSATAANCAVSGTTVMILAAGACTIDANQTGNLNYAAAPQVSRSFTVAKADQTISFATLPGRVFGAPPFEVSATASSGLAVTFTSATAANCTVSGTTVTILAAGTCTIDANQAGNLNYAAAPQVSRSFTVAKADQTISFATLPGRVLGAPPFEVSASASSGLAVTFTSATAANCTVSGTTVTMVAAGTCTINADQAGNGNYNAAPRVSQGFVIGTGSAPQLSVDAASVDFGGQSMGTTSPTRTVTISNTGNAAASISSISVSAQFSQAHNCTSVAPSAACTITITFTPAATTGALNATAPVTGTLTIASNAAGSPHLVSLSGTAEKSVVTHYYRSILGRAPDGAGKAYWEAEAARMASLGANLNETWFAMAMGFYNSSEYLALGRSTAEYVRDLYRTFFNREAEAEGLAYWSAQIGAGLPREVALVSFMFSTEFTQFARTIFGDTHARAEVDTVVDFYRGLLARLPDTPGFDFWVAQFRQAQCQGASAVYAQVESISSAYAASGEYIGRNRTSAQYIGDLYNAFMRRGGDLAGVTFWINQIESGVMSREQVRRQLMASPEFSERINAILSQGCLP